MGKIQGHLGENSMVGKKEKKLQPAIKKVLAIKGSCYLCLPKKFVDFYGMKVGDSVALVPGSETISILPVRGD